MPFPTPEFTMRPVSRLALAFLTFAIISPGPLRAQATPTADDLIARYLKTVGGAEKVESIKSLRRTGKYTGGGGFEDGGVVPVGPVQRQGGIHGQKHPALGGRGQAAPAAPPSCRWQHSSTYAANMLFLQH